MSDYPRYFTTRCPDCKHRMEYRHTDVWGYKGRYARNDMCCHRCRQNWLTLDELSLSGGVIREAERKAYNPPDETLWIED